MGVASGVVAVYGEMSVGRRERERKSRARPVVERPSSSRKLKGRRVVEDLGRIMRKAGGAKGREARL